MTPSVGGDERIRAVLAEADGELTAREIVARLEAEGEDPGSPHRVATLPGRWARRGEIEVVHGDPYRYRLTG
jgi:hypothetical protein